jgi:lipopolysaccharide export system permease protein
MVLLTRYISAQVFGAIMLVLMVIVSLDFIGTLVEELGEIENDYTFLEAVYYLLLLSPGKIRMWLPFAAMVGCLVGLGSLANNSELTVMRAAGVSTRRVAIIVFAPTILLIAMAIVLNEFVAPHAEKMAHGRKELLQSGKESFSYRTGIWNKEGSTYMHFNTVQSGSDLHGVSIYEFNEDRILQKSIFARRGLFNLDTGQWELRRVVVTYMEGVRTRSKFYGILPWDNEMTPELLEMLTLDAQQLSSYALWHYAHYRASQGLNANYYMLEFWRKIFQPLSILSLVLVAISFVFGPLREVTMGFRVFAGVIVGVIFWTLQELLGPASLVYNFSGLIAVVVPIVLSTLFGIALLRRV